MEVLSEERKLKEASHRLEDDDLYSPNTKDQLKMAIAGKCKSLTCEVIMSQVTLAEMPEQQEQETDFTRQQENTHEQD